MSRAHVGSAVLLAAALGGLAVSNAAQPELRLSKFFQVDVTNKKVVGPAPHVAGTMSLNLVSVSVDQPQYWPNEQVHLKVVMPGRPGGKFTGTLQKRDANKTDLKGELDVQGLAVLTVLDGAAHKLQVGEYRIDVKSADGKGAGNATFSVVEGALGAVSLAYDFKQVTSVEELDKANAGWFMGSSKPGTRWGNGLSFKNELRIANQPFDGDVQCISRCMLPGCNGVQAGATKVFKVAKGKVEGTMDVSSHSGPFQIEFITPKGSLRHQFEGSSHVERDMVVASGGVGWLHRAGLAPYERTVPVPGRQIFLDKERVKGEADAFEIDSVIAKKGELTIRVAKEVKDAQLIVWSPKADGSFEPRSAESMGALKQGQEIVAKIVLPYSLVTIGGYVNGAFKEGWAMAFVPAGLAIDLDVPALGAPASVVKMTLGVKDESGAPAQVSGVLEVYDNRVASRSPMSGLASGLGDSVRATSNSVSSWQDRTGIDEVAERKKAEAERKAMEEQEREESKKDMAPSKPMAPPSIAGGMGGLGTMGTGSGHGMVSLSRKSVSVGGRAPGPRGPSQAGEQEEDEEKQEVIREGERKVVFCDVVRTDASGKATVEVTLPPQIGRVSVRFVAVRGLDHASAQKGLDVSKKASVEASLPRTFVPGASLQIPLTVANSLQETVALTATGPGVNGKFTGSAAPGVKDFLLPWAPTADGKLLLELSDAKGKSIDRRELPFASVAAQRVTFSRLVIAGRDLVPVGEHETAVVYAGPGALLKGTVTNMVTTLESWFGHAEALSAQVAARAVILSAISRKLLDDEGLSHPIQLSLDKAVRDLDEAFLDGQTNLVRPYPSLAPNPLWSAWVSRNLHVALRALKADPALKTTLAQTIARAEQMAGRIDGALKAKGMNLEEQGYNAQGDEVIPVEVDGKVVYRVLTDDAVSKFVAGKLMPTLEMKQENFELAFAKAYDTFRFLKAFQRVGALQYATEGAQALWLKGDRASFDPLFAKITRGMILAQEPGMVQGPATLGGVYSTPMAMVRYLELLTTMAQSKPAAAGRISVRAGAGMKDAAMGEPIAGSPSTSLQAPEGAVIRIDREGLVPLMDGGQGKPLGKAELSPQQLSVAGEATLSVTLDEGLDPLEYYALVAVPTTTTLKQTEDILSDYKGQLVYGQQATGGSKMQLIAVPFRGARTLKLWLEGGWAGSSPGSVAIRHIENPFDHGAFKLPVVTVTAK